MFLRQQKLTYCGHQPDRNPAAAISCRTEVCYPWVESTGGPVVKRRSFITLLGGAAAASTWPLAVRAQQQSAKIARIGYLTFGTAAAAAPRVEAMRAGLRELGYVEGKNILIEFRWAESVELLHEFAGELARSNVDIIFATSSTETEPARRATKTIPIVFATHADPVGLGHVSSLRQPGGNMTGLADIQPDIIGKRLDIFKETVPQATRIGVLWSPTAPSHRPVLAAAEAPSGKPGIVLLRFGVDRVDDLITAFARMTEERVGGVLVLASTLARVQQSPIADLALTHRVPSMFGGKENVAAGGLISYAPDHADLMRRSALYIDKILKGANPADLPVEQPTRFELVINLKTANKLGITVPQSLLARADEVIE